MSVPDEDSDIGFVTDALADGYLELVPRPKNSIEPHALDGLLAELAKTGEPLKVKLGIDPTGTDIHLGHAVALRRLREFQDAGHKVILIFGTFTAAIGDPEGRDKARPPLAPEQIEENVQGYYDQVAKILDTSPDKLEIRRNDDWFKEWDMARGMELLSDYTLADLFNAAKYRLRDEKGEKIFLSELVYRLLQGWDSVEIGSHIELGGKDQLLNCLQGREMQKVEAEKRGVENKVKQVILLNPLLRGLNGEKMSKSKYNIIALDDLSEVMFGKLMGMPDAVAKELLQLVTTFDTSEKRALWTAYEEGRLSMMELKRQVAVNIVTMIHGDAEAKEVEATFDFDSYKPNETPVVDEKAGDFADGVSMFKEIVNMPDDWVTWYEETTAVFSAGDEIEMAELTGETSLDRKKRLAAKVVNRFYGAQVASAVATSFDEGSYAPSTLAQMERKYVDEFSCVPTLPEGAEGMEVVLPEGSLEALEASGEPFTIKLRIHPKRPHYHLGHVAVLKRLREFQEKGNRVVIVVDDFGATTPTSSRRKKAEDQALNGEELNENIALALGQISTLLDMSKVEIVQNSKWLKKMSFRDMITLLSKHTLQELLGPPHNRTELGRRYDKNEPIHMDELMTYILHGYDSVQVGSQVEVGFQHKALAYWIGRTSQAVNGVVNPQILVMPPRLRAKEGKEMGVDDKNSIWLEDEAALMFDKLMAIKDDDLSGYVNQLITDPDQKAALVALAREGWTPERKNSVVRALVAQFHPEAEVSVAEAHFLAHRREHKPIDLSFSDLTVAEDPNVPTGPRRSLSLPVALIDLLDAIGHNAGKDWKRGQLTRDFILKGLVKVGEGLNEVVITDKNHSFAELGADGLVVRLGKNNAFRIR